MNYARSPQFENLYRELYFKHRRRSRKLYIFWWKFIGFSGKLSFFFGTLLLMLLMIKDPILFENYLKNGELQAFTYSLGASAGMLLIGMEGRRRFPHRRFLRFIDSISIKIAARQNINLWKTSEE